MEDVSIVNEYNFGRTSVKEEEPDLLVLLVGVTPRLPVTHGALRYGTLRRTASITKSVDLTFWFRLVLL